jgi:hypothetical protein
VNYRHVLEGASRDGAAGGVSRRYFGRKPRGRVPHRERISHSRTAVAESSRRDRYRCKAAPTSGVRRGESRATIDDAAELVNVRQRWRIAAAAEIWLAANPDDSIRDIRFDAILVAPGKIP